MKVLEIIGKKDEAVEYVERPTVKVIIQRGDEVLILNDGLLPGGGVDDGETNEQAITRELLEELGVTVRDVREIGQVTQYRNFLGKEYKVYGYTAQFEGFSASLAPQDAGEAAFTYKWLSKDTALQNVSESISRIETANPETTNDTIQGSLYNRITTLTLLRALN